MLNASNAFRRMLYEGKRNYLEYVDMELADGTQLNLTNKDLWGGGLTFEDAVSSDESFDIGAAIINKCTVVINNINEKFSEYDFTNASIIAYVALELKDGTIERKRKGVYAVDEARYNGSIITLSCLDNMRKFDKAYSNSTLIYPASLGRIVRDACSKCDVILRTETFPHDDFTVDSRPGNETTTFREVISWAAQIAGCFCRCDTYGRLEVKWYDQEALEIPIIDGGTFQPWTKGESVSGGTFSPWTEGEVIDGGTFGDRDGIHHIYARYSMDMSVDDVVITGVRVQEKTEQDEQEAIVTYQNGKDGYVVSVENNDMIQGGAGERVAGWLGDQLIGFRFRKASVSHPSDPCIEAGDVGFLSDRKGNTYRIVISSTVFSTGGSQATNSSAQNPARNSADRLSAETKNYVDNRKLVEKERTDRERALEQLSDKLANSPGLYRTEDPPGGENAVQYLHDMPTIAESKTVIKITSEAIGISNDGGKTYPYGLTLDDGTAILNKIYAIGIDADHITTGAFEIKRGGKTLVLMDKDTGQVILRPDVFELSSGKSVEEVADDISKEYYTSLKLDMNSIETNVSQIETTVDGNYTELSSKITQNANAITAKVSTSEFSSLFKQEAKGITLGVTNGTDSSTISLSGAGITAQSKMIKFTGDVVFASNLTNGTTKVSGNNIYSGTIAGTDFISRGTAYIGSVLNAVYVKLTSGKILFMTSDHNSQTPVYQRGSVGYKDYKVVFTEENTVNGVSGYDFYMNKYSSSNPSMYLRQTSGSVKLHVNGAISSSGEKSRVSETVNYSDRLLYCYEMPSPMFGDIGEAVTDENGECYIYLDDIFSETVSAEIEYQVFLQKEGAGDIWVEEKNQIYFMAKGTENLKFAWEIKAKQRGYEYERMEAYGVELEPNTIDYEAEYEAEISQLIREQEDALYEAAQ